MPEISFRGEVAVAVPEITLKGVTLDMGEDYYLTGGYLVTSPGEYTISAVGMGDYAGSREAVFTSLCFNNF